LGSYTRALLVNNQPIKINETLSNPLDVIQGDGIRC
jgi:hypothetical protein